MHPSKALQCSYLSYGQFFHEEHAHAFEAGKSSPIRKERKEKENEEEKENQPTLSVSNKLVIVNREQLL